MDRVVLAENCYLDGQSGAAMPNLNVIVPGGTGSGKTTSTVLPTILSTLTSSIFVQYEKPQDVRNLAHHKELQGYDPKILDLIHPKNSTALFDPLQYVHTPQDIENLSHSIVYGAYQRESSKDRYWNLVAQTLSNALLYSIEIMSEYPDMCNYVDLFNMLQIEEDGRGIRTTLDPYFEMVESRQPDSPAVHYFKDFHQLPYGTAACARDTLAQAIRFMFPEEIRPIMQRKGNMNLDFKKIANHKTFLAIITSPVNVSLHGFANLVFGIIIKELLEYAQKMPAFKLPIPVKFIFDDFACGAKITNFANYISIFRAAGISAIMLVQSETQLNTMYSLEEAKTIIDNCSTYLYYPGGMDLTTCKNIAERIDVPLADVMYMPIGKVIVMRAGMKPVIADRYDTFHSKEFLDYQKTILNSQKEKDGRQR